MQLSHPNMVRIFDIVQDDQYFFIVQELVLGGDLLGLSETRKFTEQEVAIIIRQLTSVVNCLHSQGFIHRDIKSANILVQDTNSLFVKLTDFGFSVKIEASQPGVKLFCGTPSYMAPEIVAM